MSHKNRKSLPMQVFEALEALCGYGRSKHQDKRDGISSKYIYSFSTMATYKKHCVYFVQWCKQSEQVHRDLGHTPRTLQECRPYAEIWLQEREGHVSASTLQMEKSALAKLYGEPMRVEVVQVRRADIKRSRHKAKRDVHFSEERNHAMVAFCKCAGPRRRELTLLDASALEWHDNRPYIRYTKGTKGGRTRLSPLVGSPEEIEAAVLYVRTLTGNQTIHTGADIHSYRAEYAARVYHEEAAEDVSTLKGKTLDYTTLTGKWGKDGERLYKSALYTCRGDQKGVVFDRRALLMASRALGHSREDVIASHYLYTLP